jgi:hypothetical protein
MPTNYAVKANNKGHSFELVELASTRDKKPNELSTFNFTEAKTNPEFDLKKVGVL